MRWLQYVQGVVGSGKGQGHVAVEHEATVARLLRPEELQVLGVVAAVELSVVGLGIGVHLQGQTGVGIRTVRPDRELHGKLDEQTVANRPVADVGVGQVGRAREVRGGPWTVPTTARTRPRQSTTEEEEEENNIF